MIRGKSGGDLVRKMRGKPGSKVKLTVKRAKRSKPLYFTLKREIIKVASVKGKLLDGNIFYLRLKQFQSGTHKELLKTIGKLRSETEGRVAGVVLDLRNNPGGLVDESSARRGRVPQQRRDLLDATPRPRGR